MSRLTSSLFPRLSSFHRSPESHSNAFPPSIANPQDYGLGFEDTIPESPGAHSRKPSSIPYHSSSLRDDKAKGQRTRKLLILVIPPPTLLYGHGHTLSNGPFHRLSDGVAIPLFPSMTTQLAAIAREFSFPSTSGLCLYFHHVEDGLIVKPRISDDSWPSLWNFLSDPLGPNERRPLFSGRVEFDIDLRLARWYASWLSSIHRELSDYHTHPFPSTGPLSTHSHIRGESQDTLPEGRPFDVDVAEDLFTQSSELNRRRVPRKLSLVERFDLVPVPPNVPRGPAFSPPDFHSAGSQVLSTLVQEEELKASGDTLDTRVESWRESALLIPNLFTATDKTSLGPTNLSKDMPLNNELLPASAELNMEDFTWSISSAGPSSVSEVHIPSIHRVSTPDLAHRLYENVPLTPQTATTWGAPLSYPPSPRVLSPSPSLDLGERSMSAEFEVPSLSHGASGTAVWPHVWPYINKYSTKSKSPEVAFLNIGTNNSTSNYPYLNIYNPIYPYLEIYPAIPGAMALSSQGTPVPSSTSTLDIKIPSVYPSFDIYPAVYPFNLQRIYPSTPISVTIISQDTLDLAPVFPSEIKAEFETPYPTVYPFNLEESHPAIVTQRHPVDLSEDYPYFNIYPPLNPPFYAHLALYDYRPLSQYPEFPISSDCPTVQDIASEAAEVDISQSIYLRKYPILNIYPAVYPFFDLYPAIEECEQPHVSTYGSNCELLSSTTVESVYPSFNIYPLVYPHFEIYPIQQAGAYRFEQDLISSQDVSQLPRLRNTYPFFDLYPALYPHFDLYPAPGGANVLLQPSTPKLLRSLFSNTVEPTYPTFNLYPAVYPYFDFYLPLPELEIPSPSGSNKRQTKSSSRPTHSELHAMVMMEIIEPARLFGRMEGTKKFQDGHQDLDIHEGNSWTM